MPAEKVGADFTLLSIVSLGTGVTVTVALASSVASGPLVVHHLRLHNGRVVVDPGVRAGDGVLAGSLVQGHPGPRGSSAARVLPTSWLTQLAAKSGLRPLFVGQAGDRQRDRRVVVDHEGVGEHATRFCSVGGLADLVRSTTTA